MLELRFECWPILLADRSREKQRMESLLEDAGVKLSIVASDIVIKSGRALAERAGCESRSPPLAEALTGRFSEHHAFLAQMIVTHIGQIGVMNSQLDARIDA